MRIEYSGVRGEPARGLVGCRVRRDAVRGAGAGVLVAALSLGRVVMTLFDVRALDVVTPITFLVLIIILSVLLLRSRQIPVGAADR